MPAKLHHECERCEAKFHFLQTKLEQARERIAQLQELVNTLPDPVPDIELLLVEERESDPFA